MVNHPNRSLTDNRIGIIKGMLARGDTQQSIVACFGGIHNSGRIAEIHNSMTRSFADGEATLTTRARQIPITSGGELPPPPPYPSPYEIMREKAALRALSDSLRAMNERINVSLAMLDRVLK